MILTLVECDNLGETALINRKISVETSCLSSYDRVDLTGVA